MNNCVLGKCSPYPLPAKAHIMSLAAHTYITLKHAFAPWRSGMPSQALAGRPPTHAAGFARVRCVQIIWRQQDCQVQRRLL